MFRQAVAGHYRAKGYTVREQLRVEGQSGQAYAIDMLCEGPLGALLVSFGDAGGVDGPELGRVKQLAKDIGATPVLAHPDPDALLRRVAGQMAVVVLDAKAVAPEAAFETPAAAAWPGLLPVKPQQEEPFAAHPWPESGRAPAGGMTAARDVEDVVAAGRAGTPAAAGVLAPPPSPEGRFAWLGAQAKPGADPNGALERRLAGLVGSPQATAAAGSDVAAATAQPQASGFTVSEGRSRTGAPRWVRIGVWAAAIAAALWLLARSGLA